MPGGGRQPGAGRPFGAVSERTRLAQEASRALVDDPVVRAKWLEQARDGTLPPVLMQTFMHYAWGKPKEHYEHSSDPDFPLEIILRRNNRNGTEPESTE